MWYLADRRQFITIASETYDQHWAALYINHLIFKSFTRFTKGARNKIEQTNWDAPPQERKIVRLKQKDPLNAFVLKRLTERDHTCVRDHQRRWRTGAFFFVRPSNDHARVHELIYWLDFVASTPQSEQVNETQNGGNFALWANWRPWFHASWRSVYICSLGIQEK